MQPSSVWSEQNMWHVCVILVGRLGTKVVINQGAMVDISVLYGSIKGKKQCT